MLERRLFSRRNFWTSAFIAFGVFLTGCTFHHGFVFPNCSDFEKIPVTPLSSQTAQTVFETPGTIKTIHGSGSAKLKAGQGVADLSDTGLGKVRIIKIEQSVPIPTYANRAAVFLNGWRLSYMGSDHHVLAYGAMIAKIRTTFDARTKQNMLTWDALGLLRDNDGKEGYNFTYRFTVIAWNDGNIHAAVDQGIVDANGKYCTPDGHIADNYYSDGNGGTTTALASFFSFIKNDIFAGSRTVAVAPRGFGFIWSDNDHHLLQSAYNLDHSETFVESKRKYDTSGGLVTPPLPTSANRVDSGFVSWKTDTIFKDNDRRRDYLFAEIDSAIGGNDVGVIQPPYSILPSEKTSNILGFCSGATLGTSQVETEDFVVQNVPFRYAIPMLTGWDLEYRCQDQHVKDFGIWIDHWSYQPPAAGAGGVLRYTLSSILRDNDGLPFFDHTHKISILGLLPISAGGIKPLQDQH